MCFVGGLNISECQSTIRDVKKDLAKGKSFSHCSFVSNDQDGSTTGHDGHLRSHLIHIIIGSICM